MQALFREFRDFGQTFIGHRHLSGRTRAHVVLAGVLLPDLRLDMDRLASTVDIVIEDGGIKGHAPLIAVADHLRKNKLVAPFVDIKEFRNSLADVRFARLENRIEIRDGAVHIPVMEVRSSAMDIELSGTHWFDDRIDHHVNFRLADLFRVGKPARDEFGPIMDDGTGMRIFLHMYGTAGDPQFANDGALAAQRRRNKMQEEKAELRSILKEDLGLFKGSGATAGNKPPPAPAVTAANVQVEWDTPGDTAQVAGAHRNEPGAKSSEERERKGLGKLLEPREKDKDNRERIVVED